MCLYTSSKFLGKNSKVPGKSQCLIQILYKICRIRVYYIALYTSSKFSRKDLEALGRI